MHFRKTANEYAFGSAIAVYIADMKVPEYRSCFIRSFKLYFRQFSFFPGQCYRILGHIIKIKEDSFAGNIFHENIVDKNIFNNTTAATRGFETQPDIST